MSKYIHQEFNPLFETEFVKTYLQGVEEADVSPGENLTELVMRLRKNQGRIHHSVNLISKFLERLFFT